MLLNECKIKTNIVEQLTAITLWRSLLEQLRVLSMQWVCGRYVKLCRKTLILYHKLIRLITFLLFVANRTTYWRWLHEPIDRTIPAVDFQADVSPPFPPLHSPLPRTGLETNSSFSHHSCLSTCKDVHYKCNRNTAINLLIKFFLVFQNHHALGSVRKMSVLVHWIE